MKYESRQDLKNQTIVINGFSEWSGIEFRPNDVFPSYQDYLSVTSSGPIVETKVRDKMYSTIIMSRGKFDRGIEQAKKSGREYRWVFGFIDSQKIYCCIIYSTNMDPNLIPNEIKMGGRHDRNDPADYESVVEVDKRYFTFLKYSSEPLLPSTNHR